MKIRVITDRYEYQGLFKGSEHYVDNVGVDTVSQRMFYGVFNKGKHWKLFNGVDCEVVREECRSSYCECEEGKCSGGKVDMRVDKTEKKESVLDIQHGGSHYKDKGIQPIEYITANNLGFCEGNIVKYASRHQDKNGAEDIRKVIHYAQFILKFQYNEDI